MTIYPMEIESNTEIKIELIDDDDNDDVSELLEHTPQITNSWSLKKSSNDPKKMLYDVSVTIDEYLERCKKEDIIKQVGDTLSIDNWDVSASETQYFKNSTIFKVSVKKNSSGNHLYQCLLCNKQNDNYEALSSHRLRHTYNQTHNQLFSCSCCDKQFSRKDKALSHYSLVHDSRKHHMCTKCNAVIATDRLFEKHKATCVETYRQRCSLCGIQCCSSLDLRNHSKNHYKCMFCSSSFDDLSTLVIHEKLHIKQLENTSDCKQSGEAPEKHSLHSSRNNLSPNATTSSQSSDEPIIVSHQSPNISSTAVPQHFQMFSGNGMQLQQPMAAFMVLATDPITGQMALIQLPPQQNIQNIVNLSTNNNVHVPTVMSSNIPNKTIDNSSSLMHATHSQSSKAHSKVSLEKVSPKQNSSIPIDTIDLTSKILDQDYPEKTECPDCYINFGSLSKYRTHKCMARKSTSKALYTCRYCNNKYNYNSLLSHENLHSGICRFICQVCGQRFPSNQKRWRHTKRVHQKISYPSNQETSHSLMHVDYTDTTCKGCKKEFPVFDDLIIHECIGENTSSYRKTCRYCGKRMSPHNIKGHENLHIGIRKFKCDSCCVKVSTIYNLIRHLKICHSTVYKCNLCKKRAFSKQENYMNHIKRFHPSELKIEPS